MGLLMPGLTFCSSAMAAVESNRVNCKIRKYRMVFQPLIEKWVSSQRGLFPVRLQPQNATMPVFSATNSTGKKAVSLCEPSQKGWLLLRPQAHHQYVLPSSTFTAKGPFFAITGSSLILLPLSVGKYKGDYFFTH